MVGALSLMVEERQDFGDETAVEAPGTAWCPGTPPGPRLPGWLWMDKDSKGSPRRDGVPLEPSGASVSHSTERATEWGSVSQGEDLERMRGGGGAAAAQAQLHDGPPLPSLPTRDAEGGAAPHTHRARTHG